MTSFYDWLHQFFQSRANIDFHILLVHVRSDFNFPTEVCSFSALENYLRCNWLCDESVFGIFRIAFSKYKVEVQNEN